MVKNLGLDEKGMGVSPQAIRTAASGCRVRNRWGRQDGRDSWESPSYLPSK